MKIWDWFNPHNIEHIKAYRHLQNTGSWPKDFIPEDVEVSYYWQTILQSKMTDEWVKYVLGE